MPRWYLCLGVCFLALPGCLDIAPPTPAIKGSGVKSTETRPCIEFKALMGIGIGNYKVTSGQPVSLKITTDDNLLPYIQSTVDATGERLHIGIKKGNYDWTITPEIEIATKELTSVNLQGKITLEAKEINTKNFTVKMEGEMDVVLSGTADELTVQIDGKSKFHAGDLKCKKVKIVCNGMCTASVYGTESMNVEANGLCTVDVLGKPAVKKFQVHGKSKVNEK